MKILILMTSFNGLSQAVFESLIQKECHSIKLAFAGNDETLREDVCAFDPDLILCPFLKQRIPNDIWQKYLCIILHPGIKGDRGPSAIDWALMQSQPLWGMTALQADQEMDAGAIWASFEFETRLTTKASLYRDEVTQAAIQCVDQVIDQCFQQSYEPQPLDYSSPSIIGRLQPLMKQHDRAIDWQRDNALTIVRKINAADSFPGVRDNLFGIEVSLFNASVMETVTTREPKQLVAQSNGAIALSTIDGAIWIGHLKQVGDPYFKLPAAWVLKGHLSGALNFDLAANSAFDLMGFEELQYRREGDIGYLQFNFHNGAMGTQQCRRLLAAYQQVSLTDVKLIVLTGGREFWSNGIHLNHIEAAADPAAESWKNINAINDIVEAILTNQKQLTIAALGSNAGAGGVMMALACDHVVARKSVMMNPHYQSMGLYGSEYWTYSLPKRVGQSLAKALTTECLPIGAVRAQAINLIDAYLDSSYEKFEGRVAAHLAEWLDSLCFDTRLQNKKLDRAKDEAAKPLQQYRNEELKEMKQCFASAEYHEARQSFVFKRSCGRLPAHLRKVFGVELSQVKKLA
ncbi:hydrogenase maturation protein [Shewanella gelidii]|uniref:Hydrogenase maturation factor HoxX n=1 Tax=Shewanella gelidii TaxID=1642821 RepID=A0A917JUA0_9GAMM|nr:hydrogenase maturation protein [Shewanella gelidii]MCL1097985.1 hydrogenase maturation protein [Shewanella gelidii]GGI85184.1 hydrogenase maturation factor HoxX [Shewanella gelidii]